MMEPLAKLVLEYAPVPLAPVLWGLAKYPEQLKWLADLYSKSFSAVAGLYDEWTKLPSYGEALERALDEVRSPPHRVLDVACGTGFAAIKIKQRFPDAEVTGVDISESMLSVAEHNAVNEGAEIAFQVGDASALPFNAEEFDLVVVHNSLVYPDELVRVTAAGGRALCVFSIGGPWIAVAWPAVAEKFEEAGADYVWGSRAGTGFFGVARRSGVAAAD